MKNLNVPPKASALMESIRGIGYTLNTAVADVVDNSIAAGARRISVTIHPEDDESNAWIRISDDGCGMNREELIKAMSLGSISPSEIRAESDLGRFGMGLKSASLSQCRRLTVASRKNGVDSSFTWDLDLIEESDEWRLIDNESMIDPRIEFSSDNGTVVLWEKIDRARDAVSKTASGTEKMEVLTRLKNHLRLTFHRFLEDGDFELLLNRRKLSGWDPFFSFSPAKQCDFPAEYWHQDGHDSAVEMQGYVIPLESDLPDGGISLFGPEDGLKLQGFYIYRGKRLVCYGGWLGLPDMRRGEEYRLARIRIDFKNNEDEQWGLDIKKSAAKPPKHLRQWLISCAARTRNASKQACARVRAEKDSARRESMWRRQSGSRIFVPARDDPVVAAIYDAVQSKEIDADLLEGCLEILSAGHPKSAADACVSIPSQSALEAASFLFNSIASKTNRESAEDAFEKREPFRSWKNSIKTIIDGEGQ